MGDRHIAWKPQTIDPMRAGGRIRCLNPLAHLQSQGYPVTLFDPRNVDRYGAIIYSKVYDNASFAEARKLQSRGIRIAFDLYDNHFYNPKGLAYWRSAGERLRRMMEMADALVASTETMAEIMGEELSSPRPITVIGDAVETEIKNRKAIWWQQWWQSRMLSNLYAKLKIWRDQGRTPLVWLGNHGSPYADGGMLDLLRIRLLLEKINRQYPLSLTVISNSRRKYYCDIRTGSIPTCYLSWHPQTFFSALKAHSISVIPIGKNPFTTCKSNNRLALSLQLGLAVVADGIPSYRAFSPACYLDNWEAGLRDYLANPDKRRHHLELGRAIIAKDWTLASIAQQWRIFFDKLLA